MPTYEYLCNTCRHSFETWQKMADDPLTVCPECGEHIRRVFYPASIVFKGAGFYKTDSANGSRSSAEGDAKKSESAAENKTESKPAGSSSSETKAQGENKAPAGAGTQ